MRDDAGNVVAWYGSITDIEDRKQAEGAQRESEARLFEAERELRRTLNSIPTMTWRAAPNGYVEQINKQAFDYTGATPDEMRGHRWQHVVHPDDLPGLIAAGNVNVPAGQPLDHEARLRRFDGEYRWFLFRLAPSRDEIGRIIAWYGSITDIEDRKQAEGALQQSEAQLARAERELRLTLDSIPTMTWRSGPNGYVQQLNKRFFDYTGTTPEQVQGKGWQSVVHPDDLQPLLEIGRTYVSSGIPIDSEGRVRRFDGTYRWFLFRPAPARDETGNIIAWYGSITDIEDRKQAEDKALEAERELQRTIDHIPVLVGTYTADGKRFFANKRALEVTGLSVEDVPTERWWKAFHPEDVEPVETQWHACVASGEPFEREVRTRIADGTYRWHLTRRVPLRDASGTVIRWYGISYDIEDRKRAEAALKRSETLLAEGQQISSTGTYAWSGDPAERMFLSDEFCRIFEYDPDIPVTFTQLTERFHPEDLPLLAEKIKRIDEGVENPEWQIRLRMPDGRIKYVRVIGRIIRLQDGRSERVGAVQDVTQRQLAEQALDKVRSELARVTRVMSLGALTASIAHEVNQPLAGIVTNASTCLRMLAADPPNVEGARETARRTIRDGNRAADVIARLRALFSKKAGPTEAVDLNEATREVLALIFSDLLRNRVIARVELDNDRPLLVTGDRVQLQQVILNLLRNALDAMSEVDDRPRHLLVKADEEEGHARLIVKDTGVGFESQGAERLFDAFYTTKDDGMGIGLSVSRSIIESHGGRLWAERNEGPGATFSFSIPRQTTSAGDESAIWMRPTRGAHDPARNA